MFKLKGSICLALALFVWVASIRAQPSLQTNLPDSQVFKIAALFYDLNSPTLKQRTLSHSELLQLESRLNGVLQAVLAIHKQNVATTSQFMGATFAAEPPVQLKLLDLIPAYVSAAPYAGSYSVPNEKPVIAVNADLVRILFDNAAIEAAKKHRPPPLSGSTDELIDYSEDPGVPSCKDSECLQLFLRFSAQIGHGHVPRSAAIYARLATSQLEARFFGTMFFVLAHELGHVLLKQLELPCDAPLCHVFKGKELQADKFAAYLLTIHLGLTSGLAIGLGIDEYTGTTNYIGFPQFFERAYSRLGYSDNPASACGCNYPSAEQRNSNAAAAAREALPRVVELQHQSADAGFRAEVDTIRGKYTHPSSTGNPVEPSVPLNPPSPRFPFRVASRVGYMDASGSILIPAMFSGGRPFKEGLALVKFPAGPHKLDRGFVDGFGHIRFRVNYPENESYNKQTLLSTLVGDFVDGRALVEVIRGTNTHYYGFLDLAGSFVISPDFTSAEDFSEGMATVEISNPTDITGAGYGFIDRDGHILIEPVYGNARSFSEGLASVRDKASERWGFIDKSGILSIPYKFESAWAFHEDVALVDISGKRAFIDRQGSLVTEGFATALPFSGGLAAANSGGTVDMGTRPDYVKGGKWGYINKQGGFAIAAQYTCARSFSNGLAAINVGGSGDGTCTDGKWGFIRRDGTLVIAAMFDDVIEDFQGGRALVEYKHARVMIDETGNTITPHNR
jgi:hypothetical protein